jgi:ectoine hydroxylase-related dioxygenase (phytanoyl-CoA dioxygenase family)
MSTISRYLTKAQMACFRHDGFIVMPGLLSPNETSKLRARFMEIHEQALDKNSEAYQHYQPKTLEESGGDILAHYPRIMMPHRFDELSKRYLLEDRIGRVLTDLFGEEPLAAQSMLYFKPPGARGQAFHQDDYYLQTAPGHCMAAWVALDDCDAENGTLFVVPGSHLQPILCPHAADLTQSFTTEEVAIPEGAQPVEVRLSAGDVLFFNGAVIHGSTPNSTQNRFRRSFICHYVPDSMKEMSASYYPLHRFNGETLERAHATGGGICGNEEWEAFRQGVEEQMKRVGGGGDYADIIARRFEKTAHH